MGLEAKVHVDSSSNLTPGRCVLCEQSGGFRDLHVPIMGGSIFYCETCHGYFVYPMKEIEYTDSSWSAMRQQKWETDIARGRVHAPRIAEWYRNWTETPLTSVLEIGCGSALLAPGFADLGVDYHGIDVDEKLVDWAKQHQIHAHLIPAEQLADSPIGKRHFDLIVSSNTFEHVNEPRTVFANLARMEFNVAVIIVPNPEGLLQRAKASVPYRRLVQLYNRNRREMAYSIDGYWHNQAYSRDTFRYLCKEFDLPVAKLRSISINHPVFGFMQPNYALSYRIASKVLSAIDSDSLVCLVIDRRSAAVAAGAGSV